MTSIRENAAIKIIQKSVAMTLIQKSVALVAIQKYDKDIIPNPVVCGNGLSQKVWQCHYSKNMWQWIIPNKCCKGNYPKKV